MKTFGQKIKELRLEKNFTQKALAEQLSVSVSTLSHWECDYQEPSFADLAKLCSFFNIEADYLIGLRTETGAIVVKETAQTISPDGKELLDIYTALSPELRVQVLEYARYFADRAGVKKRKN